MQKLTDQPPSRGELASYENPLTSFTRYTPRTRQRMVSTEVWRETHPRPRRRCGEELIHNLVSPASFAGTWGKDQRSLQTAAEMPGQTSILVEVPWVKIRHPSLRRCQGSNWRPRSRNSRGHRSSTFASAAAPPLDWPGLMCGGIFVRAESSIPTLGAGRFGPS